MVMFAVQYMDLLPLTAQQKKVYASWTESTRSFARSPLEDVITNNGH